MKKEKIIKLIKYPITSCIFSVYLFSIITILISNYPELKENALQMISSMDFIFGSLFILISTMWMILPNLLKVGMGKDKGWVLPSFELTALGIILQMIGYIYSLMGSIREGLIFIIISFNIIMPTFFIVYLHFRIKDLIIKVNPKFSKNNF